MLVRKSGNQKNRNRECHCARESLSAAAVASMLESVPVAGGERFWSEYERVGNTHTVSKLVVHRVNGRLGEMCSDWWTPGVAFCGDWLCGFSVLTLCWLSNGRIKGNGRGSA